MRKSIYCFLITLISLVLLIPACTSPSAPVAPVAPAPPATTGQPIYGGAVKLISSIGFSNLGVPYEPAAPPDAIYGAACIETLLRFDEKGLPAPWLATEWKVSPDLKSVTLTLRKGVKFHDGTDFNADATKYLLDLYRTGKLPELKSVQAVDIIDDYSVRLNLSDFQCTLIPSLCGRAGQMVSPTSLKTNGMEYHFTHPVGTGPFKFDSYKRDASFKAVKFDGYWQKGKPYLDSIEQVIVADPTAAIMSFESGEAHGINTDPETANRLKQDKKFIITSTPNAVAGIAGDSSNPESPFSKVEVRQAISYAINNDAISKLGYGFWKPATQLATSANWYYDPNTMGYPFNPAKAKELLVKAGYPNGFKTKYSYASTSPVSRMGAPVVQSNLKDIGIELELEQVAAAPFIQLRSKGWTNQLLQYTLQANVGAELGQPLLASLSSKSADYVKVIHPEDYDKKLMQALVEPDIAKRKVLYQEIMKLAVDKYCLVNPIAITELVFAKTTKLQGIKMVEYWYSQWIPEDAWLSK